MAPTWDSWSAKFFGRRSPLFGRRTAQLLLRPFGYQEAAGFHPRYSVVEQARAYFVCGGVPMYLRCFDPNRSVDVNIARNFLDPLAPLFHEPEFLLREELREVEKYTAILMSLAERQQGVTELAESSGVGRSTPYYLKQLGELGYVSRRAPLSARRPKKTSVRYSLEDPLLRFWFRFIYPDRSRLAQETPARGFALRIRPQLDAYFGGCFERLCREALPKLYQRDGVSARFDVGEYWDKDVQVDVVGVRDDGWIDLGECKWGSVRSGAGLAREIRARAGRFPNPDGATLQLRMFTRARVRSVEGVSCLALEDLYGWMSRRRMASRTRRESTCIARARRDPSE